MATVETPGTKAKTGVREMSWDPITRIVGSLGIHTEIDFDAQKVNKCYSTSMIFRGFDIFMKGIDPRDTHFLTSRICGICGDNHCTTSVLCQNMAYGIYPPKLGNCAYNLAELADYMFDHAIYNDCMCNVDFCEQMVKDTNPSLLAKAEKTRVAARRHPRLQDDRRHHAGAQPVHGRVLPGDAAGGPLHARDVLPVRRAPHAPVDDHAGRRERGHHAPDVHGLLRAADALHGLRKRTVPMHDDIYDFFLQELPGYDDVGLRRTDLVCWGAFDDPDVLRYDYKDMTDWGRTRYVTPGIVLDGELITTDLVEINLAIRILLGSSLLRRLDRRGDLRHAGPARQPGRQAPPVEQGDAAQAAGARLQRQVLLGRLAAHLRQAQRQLRRLRHRRRPVRPPVGHGEGRPRRPAGPEGDRHARCR